MPEQKKDVGIITIREDEYKAVLEKVGRAKVEDGREERRYRCTSIKCRNGKEISIAITRCNEQGNIEAASKAKGLVDDLSPRWIFVVGIAGGIPDSDFSLGDVVVSSGVLDFTLEASKTRGDREYSCKGRDLHDLAKRIVGDIPGIIKHELAGWHKDVKMRRPSEPLKGIEKRLKGDDAWKADVKKSLTKHFSQDRAPIAIAGAIASSDRLVKEPEIIKAWKKGARHIKAVEMELAGVCHVIKNIPVLGIRGISDIIGLERNDVWTNFATKTAATFTIELVRSGLIPFDMPLLTETSREENHRTALNAAAGIPRRLCERLHQFVGSLQPVGPEEFRHAKLSSDLGQSEPRLIVDAEDKGRLLDWINSIDDEILLVTRNLIKNRKESHAKQGITQRSLSRVSHPLGYGRSTSELVTALLKAGVLASSTEKIPPGTYQQLDAIANPGWDYGRMLLDMQYYIFLAEAQAIFAQ